MVSCITIRNILIDSTLSFYYLPMESRRKKSNIMKRFLSVILLSLFIFMSLNNVYAGNNDTKVKSAEYYGAQKGGFSLSVGVLPVVNFVGNMFNGTVNQSFSGFENASSLSFNGNVLAASYFLSDKVALTAGVGLNCSRNKVFSYNADSDIRESIRVTGSNELVFTIGANYLLRPGARIQPILGGGLMYGFASKNFEKVDDNTSVGADFNHKTPSTTLGIICNVGVECFLSKTISISAVADLALTMTRNKSKVNDWDEKKSTLNSVQTKVRTGKFGGNLALNFYF